MMLRLWSLEALPGGPGRSLQAAVKAHKAVGLLLTAAPPWAFVFLPKQLLCSRWNDRKSECDTTGPHVHALTMCCETLVVEPSNPSGNPASLPSQTTPKASAMRGRRFAFREPRLVPYMMRSVECRAL